jgi:hypothetical protein
VNIELDRFFRDKPDVQELGLPSMAHAPNWDERFMLMELPSDSYRAVSHVIDGYSA